MSAAKLVQIVPTLRVHSYAEAVAFYVEWLGFHLDWEWRREPQLPAIVHISRDGQALFLSEEPDASAEAQLRLRVSDLDAYAAELNARRPGSATIFQEPPYDIPTLRFTDPFGNQLGFQKLRTPAEQAADDETTARMRSYVRQRHANAGEPPTPEQVVEGADGSLGLAIQVLAELP